MKTFEESINCANDDNLKERFENAWRRRQVNEGYYNAFDPENKDHAKIYNMFLETYNDIAQHLGPSEKYELIPNILEQLADDIRNDSGKGQLEYLAEAIDTQKLTSKNVAKPTKELMKEINPAGRIAKETGNISGVEKYSLIDKGDALAKETAMDDKSIESLQKQLCAIEKKIEILYQKKRNLEIANPLNDTKSLTKEIEMLQKQQERIQNALSKFEKDTKKIELN